MEDKSQIKVKDQILGLYNHKPRSNPLEVSLGGCTITSPRCHPIFFKTSNKR
jgi:hypothetical protein